MKIHSVVESKFWIVTDLGSKVGTVRLINSGYEFFDQRTGKKEILKKIAYASHKKAYVPQGSLHTKSDLREKAKWSLLLHSEITFAGAWRILGLARKEKRCYRAVFEGIQKNSRLSILGVYLKSIEEYLVIVQNGVKIEMRVKLSF